jgi:hypothetical protein
MEHIPDMYITNYLQAICDRTKPGGTAIMAVPTTNIATIPKKHYRHYDIALFERQLRESGVGLEMESYEYIVRPSRMIKLYERLTSNRLWFADVKIISKMLWKYSWDTLRFADEKNGRHLVVVLRKQNY